MSAPAAAPPRRILVSHPGSNHLAYQLVAAAQALGHDCSLRTGYFYRANGRLERIVRCLPAGPRSRLERELRRRFHPRLDPSRVHLDPLPELIYVTGARARLSDMWLERLIAWRNEVFDRRIAARIAAERPDIVIGHDGVALLALRAAKQHGAVAVLNQVIGHLATGAAILREEAELCPDFADTLSLDTSPAVLERCRAEAAEADRVLAPSDYVRDTLIANGIAPERIVLLPYGVDVERFRPGPPRDADATFRILFVGLIGQRKGVKYLLEAMRRLALPRAELVMVGRIAGDGSGLAPYRDLFTHVPHVPFGEVHALYQSADVFVYPSLHEGSAFATFEALASGLPVIATPNAGSVVRDGEDGFIVPLRDVEALMERIATLYRDRERRRAMAVTARARAEQFTWDHYRARLGAAIESWCGGSAANSR